MLPDLNLSPEYIHVVINHLPIEGLLMGIIGLVLSLIFSNKGAKLVSLSLILISSLSVMPISYTGEQAYERIETRLDKVGEHYLEEHEERAEKAEPALYVTAVLALLTMLTVAKAPKFSKVATNTTLIASCIAFGMCGWAAQAGGKIAHEEFRGSNVSTAPVEQSPTITPTSKTDDSSNDAARESMKEAEPQE